MDASGNDAGDIKVGGGLQGQDETIDNADVVLVGADATVSANGGDSGDAPVTVLSIEARANIQVNIREAPGPGCPIIGSVPLNQVVEFLLKTNWRIAKRTYL